MSKKQSLTQIFTTKELPKEYAKLFKNLHEICVACDNPDLTPADLLSEAIYDLYVKHLGESSTERSLKYYKEVVRITNAHRSEP